MSQRPQIMIAAGVFSLAFGASTASAQKVYWTDWQTKIIQRANLDGTGVEDLVTTGLDLPFGLALDLGAGKMYWTDAGTKRIQRANLDGTDVWNLVTSGLSNPREIAVDPVGGKMYWTDTFTHKVQRANLDGTSVEDLVVITGSGPRGITLDVAAGKMYWTDSELDKIRRANLDGSEIEELITTGLQGPRDIVLDTAAGKMYWIDWRARWIQRANLDGSDVQYLITTDLSVPFGLMLDVAVGKMYWVDGGTGKVQRANLDGTAVEDLVTGLGAPIGIELDLRCVAPEDDCQSNGNPDECDIVSGASVDCDGNGIPDECDIADCTVNVMPEGCKSDCNGNGIADSCDIYEDTSEDCTGNGIPDECEPDCNGSGLADSCDIAAGTSEDCTGNGVPDECEPDCNGNGVADSCDILDGTSDDCTVNYIPDECDPDCNENGIPDECETLMDRSLDCDGNNVIDECEVANGITLPCAIVELVPSGSTGEFRVDNNRIIIPSGGAPVELEVMVSGWGNAPGSPRLGGYAGQLDVSSLLGLNSTPPNPGVNLYVPAWLLCSVDSDCPPAIPPSVTQTGGCGLFQNGSCDDHLRAFAVLNVCWNDLRTPCASDADCPGMGDICVGDPRYRLPPSVFSQYFVYWEGVISGSAGELDPGDGIRAYIATLRFLPPPDASGTYTVKLYPSVTRLTDAEYNRIRTALIPGRITIGGACCMGDGSCEFLVESECDQAGGSFLFGLCEDDADGDEVADACDPCPNDNPDDTDGDGVCDSDDGCPLDANKTDPGLCGCGFDELGDSDGDGISDCDDQCPGIDDAIFAPDCVDTIPTVSTWGVVALTLLLLVGGKLSFGRKHARSD